MRQGAVALLAVALLSLVFRDYLLAAAAALLCALTLVLPDGALTAASKPAFSTGIFFLMIFILLPIATERVKLGEVAAQLKSPLFFLSIAAAAAISYLGGRGVAFLQQPSILFAVVLGTLIGVLFFRGLPAGLIIAAGLVSLAAQLDR